MVCQVLNLSDKKVFERFIGTYKIFREVFENGLYGLEIRNLSTDTAEEIFKIILDENEICYKKYPENNYIDLFIPGSINQLRRFAKRVISSGKEDIGYRLQKTISNYSGYDSIEYKLGNRDFVFNRAYIMGILNVTPDSFSDGGKYLDIKDAVSYSVQMIDDGADFIDVGGESTRPGSDPVNEEEEIKRVIPVISSILEKRPDAIISIDTTKSNVAAKALESGAQIVNDISGLTFDPGMIEIVSKFKAAVVIMHIKGRPKNMQQNPEYKDVVEEVFDFLYKRSFEAARSGIKNIFVDPGIGFGKTFQHNFELLKRLGDFKSLGYPILTGVSRKSFIGKILNLEVDKRDSATAIVETGAVLNGARILRTHNVKYCNYVTKLTEKLA